MVWTQLLCLDGEHRICEPKRLRYRILHVAGHLTRHARRNTLHLPADWPWAGAILRAFERLQALPAPADPRPPPTAKTIDDQPDHGCRNRDHSAPPGADHRHDRPPPRIPTPTRQPTSLSALTPTRARTTVNDESRLGRL